MKTLTLKHSALAVLLGLGLITSPSFGSDVIDQAKALAVSGALKVSGSYYTTETCSILGSVNAALARSESYSDLRRQKDLSLIVQGGQEKLKENQAKANFVQAEAINLVLGETDRIANLVNDSNFSELKEVTAIYTNTIGCN